MFRDPPGAALRPAPAASRRQASSSVAPVLSEYERSLRPGLASLSLGGGSTTTPGGSPLITSAANPRLKLVRKLQSGRQRRKLGLFAVEGEDLVDAGLAAGLEPVDVLRGGDDVDPELLADVSTLAHASRVIAVFRTADLPRLEPSDNLSQGLALWRVADPGNVGTLIRAADGFGAFVCLSAGCADPTGPKSLRASAGAIFRVPMGRFDEAPGRRIALDAHGGRPLSEVELDPGVCFVLGAEREGLPAEVAAGCDERATIPLADGAESLNVAAAGSIALYEWSRRNR